MNNRALTLSLVMAIIAVFMVQSYVQSIEEQTHKKFGEEVLVVQAKVDIKEGVDINEKMLELKPIPKQFREPGAIFFPAEASSDSETSAGNKGIKSLGAAGMVALVPIHKGEQISYNKMIEPGLRTGLAPQVTPGRRAMAVPVSEISGVG